MRRFGASDVVCSDGFAVSRCNFAEESYLEGQSALVEALKFSRAYTVELSKFLHEELVVEALWFKGLIRGVQDYSVD